MELIQERYRNDPWKVLAICILLNRTRGSFAYPIIKKFFGRYRCAREFLSACESETEDLLRPLGLLKTRYRNLKQMTIDYVAGEPFDRIRGIGRYGQDAWMIFVEGNSNVRPTDDKLRTYLSYLKWKRF